MRKIILSDVPKLARIIKSTGAKESILAAYQAGKEKDADTEKIGANLFFGILENCGNEIVEKQIYDLLSGIIEDDAQNIPLDDLMGYLKKICEENNVVSFFESALKLKLQK